MSGLIFGTSGWSYKEWVGPFYEKEDGMFSYYIRFFRTAEINSTFYRYPTESTIYGLNRTSPKDFIFSAKLPQVITHEKRLGVDLKVKSDLLRFLELLEPLKARGKLGCLLIQLPPSFTYERDYENFAAFLELLPEDYEFAAEFRHRSWIREDTWKLLKKHNVAYCVVDEPLLPPEIQVTADFAYFRWHGKGKRPWYDYHYSEDELREWVPRIEKTRDKVKKVYGYFNNHYHGYAVENCIEVLEMLNSANLDQGKVKEAIVNYNKQQKRPARHERKLEEFGFTVSEPPMIVLFLALTDKSRLERGMEISDADLTIHEATKGVIRAKVRDYVIEIDRKDRIVKHNCDDWRKGLEIKRICKHIVKLMLSIPPQEAESILRDLIDKKSTWTFSFHAFGN